MLNAALRHNSDEAIRVRLGREEFVERLSAGEYENLPPRDLVSFYSPVEVAGEKQRMHLPLLDLSVKPGSDGEASAIDDLDALGLRGLLFMSGRSYHFYGAERVNPPHLVSILGRAQLLSPIIDSRWVAHQLIDSRCGLRISTDSEKTPNPPGLRRRGWHELEAIKNENFANLLLQRWVPSVPDPTWAVGRFALKPGS